MTIRTFFVRIVLLYGCRRGTKASRRKSERKRYGIMTTIIVTSILATTAVVITLIATR